MRTFKQGFIWKHPERLLNKFKDAWRAVVSKSGPYILFVLARSQQFDVVLHGSARRKMF